MQTKKLPNYFLMRFPKRWWLRVIILLIVAFGLFSLIFIIWFTNLDISKLSQPLPKPVLIYDKDGKLASELFTTKIEAVTIDHIPKQLRDAVVATEDRRFYAHSGVDLISIARALWKDIKSQEYAEGGSTITQQLAKNMFLPMDKTLGRKLKEAAYALKIELNYSKDEILELYLNHIYYGEGQWGIGRAAQTYFSKNTENLTLAESAVLAGIPKAPTTYNPIRNKESALERRNTVLALMNEQKFITNDVYQKTVVSPLSLAKAKNEQSTQQYSDFMDKVMSEAAELYGIDEAQLLSSGFHIHTTLDPVVQKAAEAVYHDDQFFPASKPDQLIQSGTVVIDQHSGAIRAIVGHRGDGVVRGFNYATMLKRQPGSSFKPLSVYGPALENGYKPESMLFDGDLNINGYQPQDYDKQTRGQVTLQEAITKSWNIPAVWLLHQIGIDTGIDFATRAGISLTKDDRKLGIALGGLSEGTSPLEMAQAFTAFANQGEMIPAHTINNILTNSDKIVIETKPLPTKVTQPEVAYTMTDLLVHAVNEGTGQAALLNRPTAGKTGTTELPATAEFAGITGAVAKDAWFVGYTPELTAAVWVGYDKTDKDHYLTSSSSVPAGIFREILAHALEGQPIVPFTVPASVVQERQKISEQAAKDNKKNSNNEDKGKGNKKGRGKGHGRGNSD
jgi:penicillin-binding protein 2A